MAESKPLLALTKNRPVENRKFPRAAVSFFYPLTYSSYTLK